MRDHDHQESTPVSVRDWLRKERLVFEIDLADSKRRLARQLREIAGMRAHCSELGSKIDWINDQLIVAEILDEIVNDEEKIPL
jgi:hypothetical protein